MAQNETETKPSIWKQWILPPLVLTIICVVCVALLALANLVTEDKIAAAELESIQESLSALPGAGDFTEIEEFTAADNDRASVDGVYEDENGQIAVLITADGYNKGGVQTVIGVKDGAITGVAFVSISETPGLGTKLESNPELMTDNLTGVSSVEEVEAVDGITGATYSSKAMRAAAECALETAANIESGV